MAQKKPTEKQAVIFTIKGKDWITSAAAKRLLGISQSKTMAGYVNDGTLEAFDVDGIRFISLESYMGFERKKTGRPLKEYE